MANTIYQIETHEQALHFWRQQGIRNARLLHIDFHCDMRGLLINQKNQMAWPIWNRFPDLDEGNFLKHAVMEGVISGVRWFHDEPGGRKDDIKSVKFESDLSALPHRLSLTINRTNGIPVDYEMAHIDQWSGIRPGEILDIDWDYFAANEYEVDSIDRRVERFLSLELNGTPEQTIVCHSPEYCHESDSQLAAFVDVLATRFEAEVVNLPRPGVRNSNAIEKKRFGRILKPVKQFYHHAILGLRKRGVF